MKCSTRWSHGSFVGIAGVALAPFASAQVYVAAPSNVPSGAPGNASATEQVDFADVDLDGDWDAAFADGGDFGNDQNRVWINAGGAQAGTLGVFIDDTAARMPAVNDTSRDLEFVDFDADGDPDILGVNSSSIVNQSTRWWTNQGGLQAGSAGFWVDETAARWVGLGGPGSSISHALVLPSGGFISFPQEHAFADVDGDGDLDLIAAAVGGAFGGGEPTRVFLNDGLGFFTELNPSGVQLAGLNISNGDPGLWAQGLQQHDTNNTTGQFCDIAVIAVAVDVADLEGDFDLDVLLLDRNAAPRMFRNLSELGTTTFRDVTGLTWPQGYGGSGKYEQDFGDLDGDDDLDLFGLNWSIGLFADSTLENDGAGVFVNPTDIPGTSADNDDGDLLDFDADGDLDVYVAGFSGSDLLLRNDTVPGGAITFAVVPGGVAGAPSSSSRDVDAADVDGDGDYDVMLGNDQANVLMLNVAGPADSHAPRIPLVEQPADHGGGPTRIRAHVYDDAPDYLTAYNVTELLWSVDGGPFQSAPMRWVGAQVFHGELPAGAAGNVRYRVRSTDEHGNQGLSKLHSIHTAGGCSGSVATYCTGKPNSQGCTPTMSFVGAPSASQGNGFVVSVLDLVPGNNGLVFYSKTGAAALPFFGGLLCTAPPVTRTGLLNSGAGGTCGGSFTLDFNAYVASGADPALVAGAQAWLQAWSRDPAHPSAVSTSDALALSLCN